MRGGTGEEMLVFVFVRLCSGGLERVQLGDKRQVGRTMAGTTVAAPTVNRIKSRCEISFHTVRKSKMLDHVTIKKEVWCEIRDTVFLESSRKVFCKQGKGSCSTFVI